MRISSCRFDPATTSSEISSPALVAIPNSARAANLTAKMSGFEVAGVLLGSIPIVVSALEFYIKGIGTMGRWRRFTLELESLVLKLGTEEAKLQNVYEKLLRDIVPDDQIEPMLVDPFGPLWTEPGTVARIRRRLWRHMKLFEENVRSMNIAMEDMKQKLNIGPDGKVSAYHD